MATPANQRLASLDAMRGIAALVVVAHHAEFLWGGQIVPNGYLAVDLFFILSGFVIARAYDARLRGGWSFADFAKARLLRLWPLYLLGLSLGVLVEVARIIAGQDALSPAATVAATILNAGFLPAPLGREGHLFPLNIPAWSLFFELVVNFGYAAAASRLTTRRLIVWTLVCGAILSAGVFYLDLALLGVTWETALWGLPRAGFGFGVGLLLHRAWQGGRLPRFAISTPILLTALGLALAFQIKHPIYNLAFLAVIGPALVALGSLNEPTPRFAHVANWLAEASYPVYAIHYPVIIAAAFAADVAGLPRAGVGVALVIALLGAGPVLAQIDAVIRRRLTIAIVT